MKSNHIGIENFTITDGLIGKGGMSNVYWCQDKDFVAKKLSLYTVYPWIELYIMESPLFQHKHINQGVVKLKFDGVYIYQKRALGSLKALKFNLTREQIFYMMRQLVDGVSFLHAQGIIHCDLKPSNILFSLSENKEEEERIQLKITDFGLSTKKNWHHQAKIGSARFRAPEANQEGWDERIDIWGLGHILYFLLTRQELFSSNYTQEIKTFEGLSPNPSFTLEEEGKMKDLWLTCKLMLEPNPEERISMKDLCSFFNVPLPSSLEFIEDLPKNYQQEIKRVVKIMVDVGEEKYRKGYRSIAKQMVKREKMPSNIMRCFDEIEVFIRILKKVIF